MNEISDAFDKYLSFLLYFQVWNWISISYCSKDWNKFEWKKVETYQKSICLVSIEFLFVSIIQVSTEFNFTVLDMTQEITLISSIRRQYSFNSVLLQYIPFYVSLRYKHQVKTICFRKSNHIYSICETRLSESTIRPTNQPNNNRNMDWWVEKATKNNQISCISTHIIQCQRYTLYRMCL